MTDTKDSQPPRQGEADATQAQQASQTLSQPPQTDQSTEQLQQELETVKDRLLRSQAELENFRRRTARELQDHLRFASQPLVTDLLPVIDNIDRAIEAAETASDPASLLQGFKMVHQQLLDALRQHGVEPMSVLGAPFDPELHEAIAQGPSDEHEAGTVSQVGRKGYRLHERVIRPAQVVVSTGKQQEDPT